MLLRATPDEVNELYERAALLGVLVAPYRHPINSRLNAFVRQCLFPKNSPKLVCQGDIKGISP
jgi:hypothetical protein